MTAHVPSTVPHAGVVEAADAASAAVAIEWQELDPELPYNKDRSGVMQQGQLRCYQLGSATLGRTMNEDDAKKGRSCNCASKHVVVTYPAYSYVPRGKLLNSVNQGTGHVALCQSLIWAITVGSCSLLTDLDPPFSQRTLIPRTFWLHAAGLVFWDVFKTAKLDSFKPKAVAAQDGEGGGTTARSQGSSKSSRVQHTTHSAGKMPPSFTTNSKKEQKMLAYIRDFQRVFQELYPHRWAGLYIWMCSNC